MYKINEVAKAGAVIVGPGGVGSEVFRQLTERGDTDSRVPILALARRSKYLIMDIQYKMSGAIEAAVANRLNDYVGEKGEEYKDATELEATIKDHFPEARIIWADTSIDTSSDLHANAIEKGDAVASANKNPLVNDFATSQYLFGFDYESEAPISDQRIHTRSNYSATVGAGSGILERVLKARATCEKVISIEAMPSGTNGVVYSGTDDSTKKRSELVLDAKGKGFTEPNPADDLNLQDAYKKLQILARALGYNVKHVNIDPMISKKTLDIKDGDEFIEALKGEDYEFNKKVEQAHANGQVMRCIASLTLPAGDTTEATIEVRIKPVPKDSPFGRLKGPDNMAVIVTEHNSPDSPSIIRAPGAGRGWTAAGVVNGVKAQYYNLLGR